MGGDEWGPWIEHDGSGCPCVGMYVQARFNERSYNEEANGVLIYGGWGFEGIAGGGYSWFWHTPYVHIIRYRIRKPRALSMLERIARDVKITVDA